MTRRLRLACCFIVCSLFGQAAPSTPPQFETVAIKRNLSGANDGSIVVANGELRAINTPLADVFGFAFQLPDDSFLQAPDWIMSERYDVIAKGPATTYEGVQQMTQSLLRSRLKLASHTEPRIFGAYVLKVGPDGSKLKKSAGTGKASCEQIGEQGAESGGQHRMCTNMSMRDLSRVFWVKGIGPRIAPQYFDRPVIDQTGLHGTYDFRLDWVGVDRLNEVPKMSIFAAVEKLGLKLDQKDSITVPMLVIDQAEKP